MAQLKLWILTTLKESEPGPYDCMAGFVIRAQSAQRARQIAAANAGDEGPIYWSAPEYSRCERLTDEGDEGVQLEDFHAG